MRGRQPLRGEAPACESAPGQTGFRSPSPPLSAASSLLGLFPPATHLSCLWDTLTIL